MTIRNSIRSWALVAVAVTSAAIIGFAWWLISIISKPDWCNRALGAADYANGRPEHAIGGCFQLLNKQIDALSFNSHMAIGTLALCLLTLVVIVLAGGKLSFTANKDGISGDIGKDAAEAARATADAAEAVADEIEEEVR